MARDTTLTDSPSSSDLSLAGRLVQGSAESWSQFVTLYGPLVDRWCRSAGAPEHALPDLGQDVFLTAYRKLHQFDAAQAGASFRGWMWKIARSRLIDFFRRQGSHPAAAGGSTAMIHLQQVADHLPLDDPTEAIDVSHLMHRALEQVKASFEPGTWAMFWRSVVEGHPTDVIAADMQVTPAAVRQARSRVLRKLRQQV